MGIWNKIKQFFNNFFAVNKKDNMLPEGTEKIDSKPNMAEKENFRISLLVATEPQDSYIVQLQQNFEDGKIKEEDISDEDRIKLRELYKEQIDTLKKSIASYKTRILKLKNA